MKEKYLQILSIILTVFYGFAIVWLYWAEPKSLEEVSVKAQESIASATTKGEIIVGTYEVDREKFEQGIKAFRADNFILARDLWQRADPEKRDARTQFYIAYSFYRQGWGRVSNDDTLFRQALEQLKRVSALDKDFRAADENLKLQTPVELRNELEEGLKVTAGDFNPFRVFGERK